MDGKQDPAAEGSEIIRVAAGPVASVCAGVEPGGAHGDWAMPPGRHQDIHFPRPVVALVLHLGWPVLSALGFSHEAEPDV